MGGIGLLTRRRLGWFDRLIGTSFPRHVLGYDLFTSYYSLAIYETPTTYWIFAGGCGRFCGRFEKRWPWPVGSLYRSIRAKSGGVVKVVNHRKPIEYSQRYSQRVDLSHATSRTVLVGLMGSWKSFFFLQFFFLHQFNRCAFDRIRSLAHSWIGQLGSGPVGHLVCWLVDRSISRSVVD